MRNGKPYSKGFTMTELVVVIGILVVIASITLATVSHIRKVAFNSNSEASIKTLTGAIDVYYQNFRAYPGPVGDNLKSGGLQVDSMTENLTLGLVGGLVGKVNAQGTVTGVSFNINAVGLGPMDLSSGKQYRSFLPATVPLSHRAQNASDLTCKIPVFVDSYPDAMPILYYRAIRGAPSEMQYDVSQNIFWTSRATLGPPDKVYGHHGLQTNGSFYTSKAPNFAVNLVDKIPVTNELLPYLHNRLEVGSPRGKDKYVLISAGVDRTYGTKDDVTSFGSVLP